MNWKWFKDLFRWISPDEEHQSLFGELQNASKLDPALKQLLNDWERVKFPGGAGFEWFQLHPGKLMLVLFIDPEESGAWEQEWLDAVAVLCSAFEVHATTNIEWL